MDTDKVTQCESLYHAVFAAMSEGMVLHQLIFDEQGQPSDYLILYANPAFTNQTGLSAELVVGKPASVAYGTGEAPFLNVYAKVAITRQPIRFENYFAPMDKLFSIKVFSPGKDQFATIFEDITERRRTEEALEKSEARYRNFAEELPLGGVITQNGLIKYTNPVSVGLIGYSQAELLDKPFLPLVHEDDHPRLMELHQKRMRGEIVESPYVVTMVRKDGQVRDWQMHTSTIEWDGKTSGLGTVARFGGDEFVVVISELDDENSEYIAQAKKVAEKTRTKLIDTYSLLHRAEGNREEVIEHRCTASIGMVLFAGEDSAENILKRADNAMYKAKAAGRNQIHIYQEAT